MRPTTTHAPTAAHSLRTTVVTAVAFVAATLAAVAVASAPVTVAILATGGMAALAGRKAVASYHATRRGERTAHRVCVPGTDVCAEL